MSTKFGSTPSNNALSIESEEATVRGTLDPYVLVRLQVNRCSIALSGGDSALFGNSVMALLAMLPGDKRRDIEKRKSEYTTVTQVYRYKSPNGWKLGTPENPVYRNKPDDDDYNPALKQTKTKTVKKKEKTLNPDTGVEEEVEYEEEETYETYGEPVLVSPTLENEENTDYYKLYLLIQDAFELSGLTWKIEQVMEDGGDWNDDKDKKPVPPPNPTDEDGKPLLKPGENPIDDDADK